MKLIRFEDGAGAVRMGERVDERSARLVGGALWGDWAVTDATAEVGRVLAPVEPADVIAIGLNYRRHAEESGAKVPEAPVVFAKLASSVVGPGDAIELPADAPDEVDYEGELAVVIGRRAVDVSEAEALDYVLGYTCANDVSARDCQVRRDKQWTRAKSFRTFCPLGPCLLVDRKVNPNGLRIRTRLNGEVMQDSNTSDMIFSVPKLVSYLSHQFVLRPGTVILTGTPEGVGFARKPQRYLRDGDRVEVEIDGIGVLANPVRGSET